MNTKLKSICLIFVGSFTSAILMIALAYYVEPNINWFYDSKSDFILQVIEWSTIASIIPSLLFLCFSQKSHARHLYFFLAGFITFLLFITLVLIASETEGHWHAGDPVFKKCIDIASDVMKCRFKFPVELFETFLQ